MDRHKLWRAVGYDYEQLRALAPVGYEPSVEVFLVGRRDPVEIGYVETRDGDDDPWIRLEALNRAASDRTEGIAHRDDYWIHVHESFVERVEIHFRQSGSVPVGFSHRVADDLSVGTAAD